ncbi:hypothetical protein Tco_0404053 [Tanacetum coccineum]
MLRHKLDSDGSGDRGEMCKERIGEIARTVARWIELEGQGGIRGICGFVRPPGAREPLTGSEKIGDRTEISFTKYFEGGDAMPQAHNELSAMQSLHQQEPRQPEGAFASAT